MLFDKQTYSSRRATLRDKVGSGLIILLGNNNAPCNYPANGYTFRQDSSFLYFTGQDRDTLALVIDADSGQEWLLGDDIDIEDIIWTGFVPSVADLAADHPALIVLGSLTKVLAIPGVRLGYMIAHPHVINLLNPPFEDTFGRIGQTD